MFTTTRRALVTFAAAIACCTLSVQAADAVFTATMDGAQTLPEPIKTQANGKVELRLSADGKQVAYTVTVDKIVNASDANIHLGSPSQNGPLVVSLWPHGTTIKKGEFSGVLAQGTFTAADLTGPLTGSPLADLIDELRAGNAYANVHTNDGSPASAPGPGNYRWGEIRGQFQ